MYSTCNYKTHMYSLCMCGNRFILQNGFFKNCQPLSVNYFQKCLMLKIDLLSTTDMRCKKFFLINVFITQKLPTL